MDLGPSIGVALKEWDSVCRAMAGGRQVVLLRKGGIYESAGEFQVEHRQFLLFPTFVHQKAEMLKPWAQEGLVWASVEPSRVAISVAGIVTDIIHVKSRAQVDAIDGHHAWTPPLIDMRFNYRPENPLYLLILRTYRLAQAVQIDNTPAYAGCKSWVPLEAPIDTRGAVAVLSDEQFALARGEILSAVRI